MDVEKDKMLHCRIVLFFLERTQTTTGIIPETSYQDTTSAICIFQHEIYKKKKTKNFLLLRQTLFLGLLLIDPRPVLENYPEQGQASFHTVVSQISQDATSSLFQVGNFPHLKSPFLVITLISPSLLLSWNIVSNLSEINLPCPPQALE